MLFVTLPIVVECKEYSICIYIYIYIYISIYVNDMDRTYSTCSIYKEENEMVVYEVLNQVQGKKYQALHRIFS